MMNFAVIFAGGTGQRMNTRTMPKQFLELHGKPIIIYTLEVFERTDDIDGIIVVCLSDWVPYCKNLIEKYGLKKVIDVVNGGKTGQESIYNGLVKASSVCKEGIVLIHDGVRPLIDEETIQKCLKSVTEHGSGITVCPATETITQQDSDKRISTIIDRKSCYIAKAPQGFYLKDILEAHDKAISDGKYDFIDSASMMRYYGSDLYTVEGKPENI